MEKYTICATYRTKHANRPGRTTRACGIPENEVPTLLIAMGVRNATIVVTRESDNVVVQLEDIGAR